MLQASELFKRAIRYSHRASTRAVLQYPREGGGFEDGEDLSVVDGNLSIDGTRNVWRSGSLSLAPNSSLDRDQLTRIDSTNRVKLLRGLHYPDGNTEWVQIGLMQVTETSGKLTEASVQLTLADLGSLVDDYKLITPYVPQDMNGNALTTVEAIKDLVSAAIVWDTVPSWNIDPSIDTVVKPLSSTVFTGSRWAAIQTLSESLGAVTCVGVDGSWNIRSAAADVDNPVADLSSGDGGVVVDYSRTAARSDQFNAIPLRWESPSIGGLVFMVDADPASPTFWNGPFGRRPRDEEINDTITSEAQAIAAASALLDQYRGRASRLSFTAVHNPLLEPLDVVLLRNGDAVEHHIIDSIDYPLAGGKMSVQTRLLRQEVATP